MRMIIHLYVLNDDSSIITLPSSESFYEDKSDGFECTTDEKIYKEWRNPYVKAEIEKKLEKIEIIMNEIEELKKEIVIKS